MQKELEFFNLNTSLGQLRVILIQIIQESYTPGMADPAGCPSLQNIEDQKSEDRQDYRIKLYSKTTTTKHQYIPPLTKVKNKEQQQEESIFSVGRQMWLQQENLQG